MPKINFATFCASDAGYFGGHKGHELPRDIEIIGYLHKSIKKHHPDSSFTVITDRPDAFHERFAGVHVIEKDINTDELLYERTKCYIDYANREDLDCDFIAFLDSDCFLIDNIAHLGEADFDIAFTCIKTGYVTSPVLDEFGVVTSKEVTGSPINGGVIFSRTTLAAKQAWHDILKASDSIVALGDEFIRGREHLFVEGDNPVKKWGDQFACMYLFGKYLIPEFPEGAIVNGAKILFLDRREYNATPLIIGTEIRFDSDVEMRIVHMKGTKRKALIPAVAKHYGIT